MLLTEHTHSYRDTGGEGRTETETGGGDKKERERIGVREREGEQITAGRKDDGKGQKRECGGWGT